MSEIATYKGIEVGSEWIAKVKQIDSFVNLSFSALVQVGIVFQGSANVADTLYGRSTMEWSLFERLYALKLQGVAVFVNRLGFISEVR